LASPVKGRSHFGSHAPDHVYGARASLRSGDGNAAGAPSTLISLEGAIAAPWLVDVSHAVMCVSMAFVLILMT
jgi:hypothetical protein